MNRNEILEQTGADNWDWIREAYGNMTEAEILADWNGMCPDEDNTELARAIAQQLDLD